MLFVYPVPDDQLHCLPEHQRSGVRQVQVSRVLYMSSSTVVLTNTHPPLLPSLPHHLCPPHSLSGHSSQQRSSPSSSEMIPMAGSVPPCPHTLGTPQILGDLLHVCRVFLSPCRVSVSQLFSYIMRKGREVGLPGRTIWCVCVWLCLLVKDST